MKKIKKNRVLFSILVIATFIRIYIAVKTPLFIQADAAYDDFLFIKYALSILKGEWLGPFSVVTLAKGCSFSLFIVGSYLLGIPYSLSLILIYIFAISVFIIAIKKIIKNKYMLSFLYLFLLFSPVMFHVENVQKVYRGGVIVAFSILTIASIIGLYTRREDRRKKMGLWSILGSLSLSFFWYLKEDSIWILPFVLGGILITIISVLKMDLKIKYKISKVFITIFPLLFLVLTNILYCSINYYKYGEYAITDRNGTYFKEVISGILLIEDKQRIDNVWITKNMMYQAIDASPTLKKIKPEIDDMYTDSWALKDGEIGGDIIYWTLKEAVNKAGIYDKGGKYVNDFYKKVDKELQQAFQNKKLKKSKDFYLTSVAKGISKKDIPYFRKITKDSIKMLVTYELNDTGVYEARGQYQSIVLSWHLTNSYIVWPDMNNDLNKPYQYIVDITNKIVNIYQKTGWFFFVSGILGIVILMIKTIVDIFNKKYKYIDVPLIIIGLIITGTVLLFGVEHFCRFLSMRKIYDYTCALIPIIQIIELIGLYYLIIYIKKGLKIVTKRR